MKAYIYANTTKETNDIVEKLKVSLTHAGHEVTSLENADTIFCVGGDGTLLNLMQEKEFPTIPIVGVNTGHLGFFQEINSDKIDEFLKEYDEGKYSILPYNIARAEIKHKGGTTVHRALNEFAVKGETNHSVHLDISINDSFIEKFSGDGILVATPAGSTAYNYSLGGSIVDPRINILQVTPIAPMNTTAYRSLTSSILIPANVQLVIEPSDERSRTLSVLFDSMDITYEGIEKIKLTLSHRKINLVHRNDQTFWSRVKDKFL